MYFVDKAKLEYKLNYLRQLTEDYPKNKDNTYAIERIGQMLIETAVDIGNVIIDGFILRDPGNYQDVIDIMALEKVISSDTQHYINRTVAKRKLFVHDHDRLSLDEVLPLFDEATPYYQRFVDEVVYFLKNENVPITAFGKKGE